MSASTIISVSTPTLISFLFVQIFLSVLYHITLHSARYFILLYKYNRNHQVSTSSPSLPIAFKLVYIILFFKFYSIFFLILQNCKLLSFPPSLHCQMSRQSSLHSFSLLLYFPLILYSLTTVWDLNRISLWKHFYFWQKSLIV